MSISLFRRKQRYRNLRCWKSVIAVLDWIAAMAVCIFWIVGISALISVRLSSSVMAELVVLKKLLS